MKKAIISVLLSLMMVSCVAYKDGSAYFVSIGMDANTITVKNKMIIDHPNMSNVFDMTRKKILEMYGNYLLSNEISYVAGKYLNYQGNILNHDTVLKIEALKQSTTITDAQNALKKLTTGSSTSP